MTAQRLSSMELLAPGFRAKVQALLVELGKDERTSALRVFETSRAPSRQLALYARGRDPQKADYGRTVTKAKPYQSAHQHGLGVDLVFWVNDTWTWDEPIRGGWAHLHTLAHAHGLEPLSFEKPHLQVRDFRWQTLPVGPQDDAGWLDWLTRWGGLRA